MVKNPGFLKKIENFSRFHPYLRDFYSIFANIMDFIYQPSNHQIMKNYHNLTKKQQQQYGQIEPEPSFFTKFMNWLNLILLNGFFLWLTITILIQEMLPVYYILGLGLARYLILDTLSIAFWNKKIEIARILSRKR